MLEILFVGLSTEVKSALKPFISKRRRVQNNVGEILMTKEVMEEETEEEEKEEIIKKKKKIANKNLNKLKDGTKIISLILHQMHVSKLPFISDN